MNEEERVALAAYRRALDAKTPDPQPSWSRLVAKIEAGAHPLPVDLVAPRRPWWIPVAVGAAAAAVLAAWLLPGFERTQPATREASDQAAMAAEDEAPGAVSQDDARLVTPAPIEEVPPEPEPEAVPVPDAVPVPKVVPEPVAKPKRKPNPARDASFDVVAEANAIRRVQEAIRDGRAAAALKLLRRYRARFPKGTLRDEAALLQADALCLDGKAEAARKAAASFVRAHPSSPLTQRATGICAD